MCVLTRYMMAILTRRCLHNARGSHEYLGPRTFRILNSCLNRTRDRLLIAAGYILSCMYNILYICVRVCVSAFIWARTGPPKNDFVYLWTVREKRFL